VGDLPVGALGVPLPHVEGTRTGRVLDLPRRRLDLTSSFAVMGIVNATPDSFYDRGSTSTTDEAVRRALGLVDEGAVIIDVGGVKGGPGPEVTPEEERDRVVAVIAGVRSLSDVLISVDTFRATTAESALEAGADIVNDVGGGHDLEILDVVAAGGAGYLAMHRGAAVRTRPFRATHTPDVVAAVARELGALTEEAERRGVAADRILVDPGHDFGKTTRQSLELCRELPALLELGYPVLVALSNKDFIGETLDAPLTERVTGSVAAAVFSVLRGASIVRAHEVRETVEALRMTEALLGWRPPAVSVRGLE
jgi:dihydropteroate synthase